MSDQITSGQLEPPADLIGRGEELITSGDEALNRAEADLSNVAGARSASSWASTRGWIPDMADQTQVSDHPSLLDESVLAGEDTGQTPLANEPGLGEFPDGLAASPVSAFPLLDELAAGAGPGPAGRLGLDPLDETASPLISPLTDQAPADAFPGFDAAPGFEQEVVGGDLAGQAAREFPAGTVDLTDAGEDSLRIPLATYAHDIPAPEPVPGVVEVEPEVPAASPTMVMPLDPVIDDHRAQRARALGEVDPGADVVTAPRLFTAPSIYKGWPSFTLVLLRLVVVTLLSIRATQEWMNFSRTRDLWATAVLPNPELLALVQICAEYAIALLLLLGLATRVAGLAMMVLYVGVLIFLVWGAVNPFSATAVGFRGELEVLLVSIGLVFAGVGGGGASVDGAIHRARIDRKNAKLGL
jgi:uncharacterized membrane protein YphA (DoxX/SURF4 family)